MEVLESKYEKFKAGDLITGANSFSFFLFGLIMTNGRRGQMGPEAVVDGEGPPRLPPRRPKYQAISFSR